MSTRRPRLSRRHRARCIAVLLFGLLFQQLAMAAYVCSLPVTMAAMSTTGDCPGMHAMAGTAHGNAADQAAHDPRCTQHCASDASASPDVRSPGVPPLLVSTPSPQRLAQVTHGATQIALPDPSLQRPEPPPSLRFCSLLI